MNRIDDKHAKDFGPKVFKIVFGIALVFILAVGGFVFYLMKDMSRPSTGAGTFQSQPSNAGKTEVDRALR